jgi:putative SOS response-associated peptidase YedK
MCNRYSLGKKQERIITREYGSVEFYFAERFNIAPTEFAQIILVEGGKLVCREMNWGIQTRFGMFTNIQAESTHKKTLKELFENRRCLVPASGFYEWKSGKPAQPYFITRATRNTFYFAGLYQDNQFSIITKPSSSFVRSLHDRMSIIMAESQIDWWLTSPFQAVDGTGGILAQGVSELTLKPYPVTTQMTNPRFKEPATIKPVSLTRAEFLPHEIDSSELRWRDITTPPPKPMSVLLLVNDEKTVDGKWDGTKFISLKTKSEP